MSEEQLAKVDTPKEIYTSNIKIFAEELPSLLTLKRQVKPSRGHVLVLMRDRPEYPITIKHCREFIEKLEQSGFSHNRCENQNLDPRLNYIDMYAGLGFDVAAIPGYHEGAGTLKLASPYYVRVFTRFSFPSRQSP